MVKSSTSWSGVVGVQVPIEGLDLKAKASTTKNVTITMEDLQDEIAHWRTAVICYVMSSNPPQGVMEGYFNRIWKGRGIDKVAQVNRGIFLVRFHEVENREKEVEEGVQMFEINVVKPRKMW